MKPFDVLSVKRVLDAPFCTVDEHTVVLPNGKQSRWWVHPSPDAVVICPILPTGEVVLQRTYKHGGAQIITELVAGCVDPGEALLTAAQREMQEEVGYGGGTLAHLHSHMANPTCSPRQYHFYVAQDVDFVGISHPDEAEQIEPFLVPSLQHALTHVLSTPKTSTVTVTGLLLAQRFLAQKTTQTKENLK